MTSAGLQDLSIAIVGAGTAGLAAAALLARQHRVTVFERVADPSPVGAGLLLQPTGMQALQQMGLLNPIVSVASRIDRLYGTLQDKRDPQGQLQRTGWPVMDMRYQDFAANAHGLGLSRHALFSTLLAQAQAAGARIITGATIAGVEQNTHGVQLHVGNESAPEPTAITSTRSAGRFDLCIVANGSFSHLRDLVGIPHVCKPYPWGALWTLLPDTPAAVPGTLRQWYRGGHQMLGLMPTGRHSAADAALPPWISLFWSVHSTRVDALRAQPLQAWKDTVLKLTPMIEPYLNMITDWSQLAWGRYADVRMPQPQHGRVLFIGDAAHGMSPQLGQGANMALIDAYTLAGCLGALENTTSPTQSADLHSAIAQAFAQYAAQRKAHLGFYQFASKWLTPLFQTDGAIMPALRNVTFWPASRLPIARTQATMTLTGYKAGLLWGRFNSINDAFCHARRQLH